MLTVETIRKVRLALAKGESQRSVAKRYNLSRTTVGKIASSEETEFRYTRTKEVQYPVLGSYIERLGEILKQESELPLRDRRTGKKVFELLQREGYRGGYDAVRRYIRAWKDEHRNRKDAYVPLVFARGEAFQFDWSDETVEIGGDVKVLQVAQVRLCHSRMPFCVAFERQEMAMVMEAHIRAHDFFGGLCERGIYDNPKTIVTEIGTGKGLQPAFPSALFALPLRAVRMHAGGWLGEGAGGESGWDEPKKRLRPPALVRHPCGSERAYGGADDRGGAYLAASGVLR